MPTIDITEHIGLVSYCLNRVKMAKWASKGVLTRRDDLIQAGHLGLIKAAEKFDESRGATFATYASWWITAYIKNECYENLRTVRVPRSSAHKLWKAGKHAPGQAISIDTGFSTRDDNDGMDVLDLLGFHEHQDDERADTELLYSQLFNALDSLPIRDRHVLRGRFYDDKTLEMLGHELDLSRERVRQIQNQALQKLRAEFTRIRASVRGS